MYQEQLLKMAIPILGEAILILGGAMVVGVAVEEEEGVGEDGFEVEAMVTTLKSYLMVKHYTPTIPTVIKNMPN